MIYHNRNRCLSYVKSDQVYLVGWLSKPLFKDLGFFHAVVLPFLRFLKFSLVTFPTGTENKVHYGRVVVGVLD